MTPVTPPAPLVAPLRSPELGIDRIADITVARNIKELGCEVHPTPVKELTGGNLSINSFLFNLPDPEATPRSTVTIGQVTFELGWERYLPAELLFNDSSGDGTLHEAVLQAIDATVALEASGGIDADLVKGVRADDNHAVGSSSQSAPLRPATSLRESLLGRVVLSGGSSQLPGLPARLEHELSLLVQTEGDRSSRTCPIKVRPSLDGDATTWLGASVLAGTETFATHWCVHAPTTPNPEADSVYAAYPDDDDDDDSDNDDSSDDDKDSDADCDDHVSDDAEEKGETDEVSDAAETMDEVEPSTEAMD